jgi:hypothetical protein
MLSCKQYRLCNNAHVRLAVVLGAMQSVSDNCRSGCAVLNIKLIYLLKCYASVANSFIYTDMNISLYVSNLLSLKCVSSI